jgi:acyl-CoA thioesterase I
MANRQPALYIRSISRCPSFLIVALFCAACGSTPSSPSASPAPAASAPAVQRIVVLGDSLAVSPSLDQGFPARLQARISAAGLRWAVANEGVSGDTTADGVRRAEPLLAGDVGILVLELGANDGLRGLATATVDNNLSSIITLAQRRNIRVLLCGMETPPTHGLDYSIAFHFVFPSVAQRFSLPLVPFLLNGVALDPELNGADGVHPNGAGAERIAETVWTYLRPML